MKTVYFHTLGCKVNQYDTQAMLEEFLKNGYVEVFTPEEADVCIVNTCTVTATADKKSLQIAHKQKKLNKNCELIIAGCMSQKRSAELLKTGARLIIGTNNRKNIVKLLNKAIKEDRQIVAVDSLELIGFEKLSIASHSEHTRAVVKIEEGCDYNCSYCIIPSVRGHVRSRLISDIVDEVNSLAENGFKEIVLTGINLTCYGKDLGNCDLSDVVTAINEIDGIQRIRISSLEPNLVKNEIAEKLASSEKLCPNFHLALQSGSNKVLGLMRRRYSTERFEESVRILREYFPNCSITTDIIVGFPGETEEDFLETLEFVKKIGFQKVHVFPFSPREGTDASKMPQITNDIKKDRARHLISISKKISKNIFNDCLGKSYSVLIEKQLENSRYFGYTKEYIPIEVEGKFKSGDIIDVEVISIRGEIIIAKEI